MTNQMKLSNSDIVQEIKDRLDIVDTVSEHVVLKKSGRNFWGVCPFHQEKTPSFSVNPEKGIYKCFGCGAGGDSISFLMKLQNQSFMEVITELAQKFGLEMPNTGFSSEKAELKKQIYEVNQKAAHFYSQQLKNNQEALKAKEYLNNRDLSDAILTEYQIGYAPKQFDALINYLVNTEKFTMDLLDKAGLVSQRSNGKGFLDRFRDRIIIPIHDEKGNVVAFGARALEDGQNPKYLNSPETPAYNKSRILYGLYQGINAIKAEDRVLIMEGYFDVITAHAHGIKNAVASSGTSLTDQHIKLISRFTPSRRIYLAFDSDTAGINATNRGAEIIKNSLGDLGEIKQFDESFGHEASKGKYSCEVRVVKTSTGKDPDEFIRTEGVDAYKKHVEKAPLLIDFQIDNVLSSFGELNTPQKKMKLIKAITPVISEVNNSITRNEYINKIAQIIRVDEKALREELNRGLSLKTTSIKRNTRFVTKTSKKHIIAQKNLLSFYFIEEGKLTFESLNQILSNIEFTEPKLALIKEHAEKLSQKTNDVEQLTNSILTVLADNEEVKNELVDIIFSVEDKKMLDANRIKEYINENIECIKSYNNIQNFEKLKTEYRTANDDEMTSLQLQYQVREQLKQQKTKLLENRENKR